MNLYQKSLEILQFLKNEYLHFKIKLLEISKNNRWNNIVL